MYEIYEKLLEMKGVTTADVCRATGIRQSTIANWKKRGGGCSKKTAVELAAYFGVSIDYIMNGTEEFNIDKAKDLARKSLFASMPEATDEIIISIIEKDYPFMLNKRMMAYIEKLWNLSKESRESIYEQIEMREERDRKKKEADSESSSKAG